MCNNLLSDMAKNVRLNVALRVGSPLGAGVRPGLCLALGVCILCAKLECGDMCLWSPL
jgi:hypothetical protein